SATVFSHSSPAVLFLSLSLSLCPLPSLSPVTLGVPCVLVLLDSTFLSCYLFFSSLPPSYLLPPLLSSPLLSSFSLFSSPLLSSPSLCSPLLSSISLYSSPSSPLLSSPL